MINQLKHFYFKFGYKRQNNLKIYKTKKKKQQLCKADVRNASEWCDKFLKLKSRLYNSSLCMSLILTFRLLLSSNNCQMDSPHTSTFHEFHMLESRVSRFSIVSHPMLDLISKQTTKN